MRLSNLSARWHFSPAVCVVVALLAGAAALVRAALGIGVFTNVVDEPFHIASAVALWDVKKHTLGTEHPPLPRLVAGLPLYLSGVRLPADLKSKTVRSEPETLEQSERILFRSRLDYRQILTRSRLAMLVFPAIALLYLFLLARWAAGDVAAMLAVVFFSFDATLLGHAFWVTTDLAACAGFLAATYHGLLWIFHRTWPRAIAAGVAIGLAISCKFTCVLVIPGLLIVLIIRTIDLRDLRLRSVRLSLGQLMVSGIVAFAALWATYLLDISPMSDQTAFGPQRQWQAISNWVKETPIPMPSLPLGVLRLLGHNRWGHPAYLNGEISRYGWWYYFPEAIAVKSPLALLVALAIAVAVIVWFRGRGMERNIYILIVGGVFLVAAMMGNLNLGVRHVLPVIAVLYLVACAALVQAHFTALLAVLIIVAGIETAGIHPDYIAFFNVAAGGPARGQRTLIDSNLDWGQDVGRLARWLKSDAAAGRSYTLRLFAFPRESLTQHLGLDPRALRAPPSGLLAISKNIRLGLVDLELFPDGSIRRSEDYSWLAKFSMIKQIGYSIEVYDLSAPQVAHGEER